LAAVTAGHFRLGSAQVGLALGDHRICLAAHRNQLPGLAYCLCQIGLGTRQRQAGVVVVQRQQQVAGLDALGVVGVDAADIAGDLRRDRYQIAGSVGVVGAFVMAQRQKPVSAPGDTGDDQRQCQSGQGSGGRWMQRFPLCFPYLVRESLA